MMIDIVLRAGGGFGSFGNDDGVNEMYSNDLNLWNGIELGGDSRTTDKA